MNVFYQNIHPKTQSKIHTIISNLNWNFAFSSNTLFIQFDQQGFLINRFKQAWT